MNKVVISTPSLNSYGTRVLTSGIDIEQYKKNPILLYMHRRGEREDAPIGRVEDVHIEGEKLVGSLVFDEKDDFARKVAQKWADGFLRMVSAGLTIIELSDDPAVLLPGQRRMTITKSKLDEVSVVDIGANDDALALYNAEGGRIALAQGDDLSLPLLQTTPTPNTSQSMNEKIVLALGLSKEATEEQVLGAIAQMKEKSESSDKLTLSLVTAQVDEAIRQGRISAEARETYLQIGLTLGCDQLSIALSAHTAPQRPSTLVAEKNTAPTTYIRLSDIPIDQLEQYKQEHPEDYARLYRELYGCDPR
jgi:caudovirus prohead protease|uniref:Prohead serine protease n=1 Tax=Myoviridae sp. ctFNi10 TaxID=2825067 RepID=A0A8S5TX23_9CAUD|nr:MAG TPA: prohead serine protease [Myoviridae sp. ctFNi10]